MTESLSHRYYLLALSAAERVDLSGAVRLARWALMLDSEHENARRLLGLCLYEQGALQAAVEVLAAFPDLAAQAREADEQTQTALEQIKEQADCGNWRKALRTAQSIPHQSARLVNIQGCLLAGAKRYRKAGERFARTLETDRGSAAAMEYLLEAAKRPQSIWEML